MFISIKIIICLAVFSCSSQESRDIYPELEIQNEISLTIKEPSGISFGRDYQSYWVVSDGNGGKIYNLALNGTVTNELNYNGHDLEGISYNQLENVLWVVEERKREVVKLDLMGNILLRKPIDIENSSKHGLEGIAFVNGDEIWISNEKSPRLLIKVNSNLTVNNQFMLDEARDYSGLCYNHADSSLWIVSDESELLINWKMNSDTVKKYTLPIIKAEGVAINPLDNTIHIVSDKTAKIYIFNMPE